MKALLLVVGIALAGAGGYVLVHGASYTQDKSVLKIGSLEAKVAEQQSIPPWAGGVALAVGAVLVVVGLGKKN